MISFIMMAKNVEKYLGEAILELQKENVIPWELIIIEDHSDDKTYTIAESYASSDQRIKLVKNPYIGKVLGTNHGYSLTTGDIIKCIDSDDILKSEFFQEYEKLLQYDAHCHSALIVDETLQTMGTYHVNTILLTTSYEDVVSNFISLPKWSWSFKREIADKIFPLPENLPFEDVWMSILIKKYAKSIYNMYQPYYLYRQHGNQTFGGILNYSLDRVQFRANRLLKLINIIENERTYLIENITDPYQNMREYLSLQTSKSSLLKIFKSGQSLSSKIKLALILHFPNLAIFATKLKWYFDKK